MQQVLSDSAPTIIFECYSDGSIAAIESILTKFGYRFFHLREVPVAVDRIVPDEKEVYRNFLCTVHNNWEEIG